MDTARLSDYPAILCGIAGYLPYAAGGRQHSRYRMLDILSQERSNRVIRVSGQPDPCHRVLSLNLLTIQTAPEPLKTAGMVRANIFRSSHIDQLSI